MDSEKEGEIKMNNNQTLNKCKVIAQSSTNKAKVTNWFRQKDVRNEIEMIERKPCQLNVIFVENEPD